MIAKDDFWDHPEETKPVLKERALLSGKIDRFRALSNELEECDILLDLSVEESDTETFQEAFRQVQTIDEKIKAFSLDIMLDGEDDSNNADRKSVV